MKKKRRRPDIIDKGLKRFDKLISFVRKRVRLFYKLHFLVVFLLGLMLAYFLLLVPLDPKSVPYLNAKISNHLKREFDETLNIDETLVSFTPRGTIRVELLNFSSEKIDPLNDNKEVKIPRIEAEFSLLKLLFLNYLPSKVRIVDAEVVFAEKGAPSFSSLALRDAELGADFKNFASFLFEVKEKIADIEVFELRNLSFLLKRQKYPISFVIDNSRVRFWVRDDLIKASMSSAVTLSEGRVLVNSSCESDSELVVECKADIEDLRLKSFAKFCEKCADLRGVDANFDLSLSFLINDHFEDIDYEIFSKKGKVFLPKIFRNPVSFSDLELIGDYNIDIDRLNVPKITLKMRSARKIAIGKSKGGYAQSTSSYSKGEPQEALLSASYLLRGATNDHFKNSKLRLSLQNLSGDDIGNFWPLFLPKQAIRKWVEKHISHGLVESASLDLETVKNRDVFKIDKLSSSLYFKDINVAYSHYFPVVSAASGKASFSKKGMVIDVDKAHILRSKVTDSRVMISDFANAVLEIDAKIQGHAADGLRHANFRSKKYSEGIDRYLNGASLGGLSLKIPLKGGVKLKNVALEAEMLAKNVENEYLRGQVAIKTRKVAKSNNFVTKLDLTRAEIKPNNFGALKKVGEYASLDFRVNTAYKNKIAIKDLFLNLKNSKKKYFSGSLTYNTARGAFSYLNLKNRLARNSYRLFYKNNKLSIAGYRADLSGFFGRNSGLFKNGKMDSSKISVFTSLKKLYLANKRQFRDVKVDLHCLDKICRRGAISANYKGNEKLIDLAISKEKKSQNYVLKGQISDVGYVLEALNLSKQVSFGNANIKIVQNKVDNKVEYVGNIKVKDKLIFYENDTVKKFAKDDLFSKVKDKIFSESKTVFGSVILDFILKDELFSVKSLIANNFKIGITVRGFYNLRDKDFEFKGMIIPGFIINNLFGVGKIPVIGSAISYLLTGGEGGGLFGVKYEYVKSKGAEEPTFKTNKVSAFVPVTIRNLFDLL